MYISKSLLIGVVVLMVLACAGCYYWFVYAPNQGINAYKLSPEIEQDLAPTNTNPENAPPLPDYILKDLEPTKK